MSVCFLKKKYRKKTQSVPLFVRGNQPIDMASGLPSLSLFIFFLYTCKITNHFRFFFLLPICHSNKTRRTIELLIGFKLPGHVNKHSLYIREYVEVKIIRLSHIIHISMMMMIMFSLFFRL
jgi:hypothetical protein